MALSIRIDGSPATFATGRERAWKKMLEGTIPECNLSGQEKGLSVIFCLEDLEPQGQPLDVDNLMEPLIFVLVGKKRWFGGRRPSVSWWRATKIQSPHVGCDLEISNEPAPPDLLAPGADVILNALFEGTLPTNARNANFAAWADEHASAIGRAWGYYDVDLTFRSPSMNIGEIATGPVKGTIDCLWPVWGGSAGSPQDWRIRTLQVSKPEATSPQESVLVRISSA